MMMIESLYQFQIIVAGLRRLIDCLHCGYSGRHRLLVAWLSVLTTPQRKLLAASTDAVASCHIVSILPIVVCIMRRVCVWYGRPGDIV